MMLLAGLNVGVITLLVVFCIIFVLKRKNVIKINSYITLIFLNAIVQKQEKTLQDIGSFDDNKRSMMLPKFINLLRSRLGSCVLQQIQEVSL